MSVLLKSKRGGTVTHSATLHMIKILLFKWHSIFHPLPSAAPITELKPFIPVAGVPVRPFVCYSSRLRGVELFPFPTHYGTVLSLI